MLDFLITDQNFDQIQTKRQTTPAGITTKLHKSKNAITISLNTMAPFAIYKWEHGKHFAISNRLDIIEEYIKPLDFELTYAPVKSKNMSKPHVNQARNCSNVEKITRWSKVVANRDGSLQITPSPKQLFSIEVTSKRGVKNLLKWLKKYLILAKQEIAKGNFIPTLSGGMDTRIFTWFWRDLYNGPDYYLKAVKPDTHNNVVKGQAEVEVSAQVLARLGKQLKRVEKFERLTFSGLCSSPGRLPKHLNDPNYIYDFMALHFAFKQRLYFGQTMVCPFIDNWYLQIKHPEPGFTHVVLFLLLCPDLLDIALISYTDDAYFFGKEFANLIPKAEAFIQQYNLRNRVAKLKDKLLKS